MCVSRFLDGTFKNRYATFHHLIRFNVSYPTDHPVIIS
nr:MAG TPA: hypothetical protein [Caudoviricetes sp.]